MTEKLSLGPKPSLGRFQVSLFFSMTILDQNYEGQTDALATDRSRYLDRCRKKDPKRKPSFSHRDNRLKSRSKGEDKCLLPFLIKKGREKEAKGTVGEGGG